MAAKKSKVSQIQKDIDKFLVDAERSIEKHAPDALKGLRKSVQALAKQARQLEKKTDLDSRAMATAGRGKAIVGYNIQAAFDTTHHLIVAPEVATVRNELTASQLLMIPVRNLALVRNTSHLSNA